MSQARKQFKIPADKKAKLTQFASLLGVKRGPALAEMIEGFVKNGTDYVPPVMEKVETTLDAEILAEAERLAEDQGFTLRDVILFEIDEIDKL